MHKSDFTYVANVNLEGLGRIQDEMLALKVSTSEKLEKV